MHLSLLHGVLLFGVALLAGAINSVAGGGTLLTFPALLAIGVPPIVANGTSTVALVPGSFSAFWGYRSDIQNDRRLLLRLGLPSLLGGLLGALLAVRAGNALFARLVPLLVLSATALFIAQEPISRWLNARGAGASVTEENPHGSRLLGVSVFQFFVAVYGGFFGAGIGILMLAALGFLGISDILRRNGVKNFAAICINGVSALTFIYLHRVIWPLALLMMAGAILGGWGGVGIAQKIGQNNVRRLVIAIGLTIAAVTFAQQIGLF